MFVGRDGTECFASNGPPRGRLSMSLVYVARWHHASVGLLPLPPSLTPCATTIRVHDAAPPKRVAAVLVAPVTPDSEANYHGNQAHQHDHDRHLGHGTGPAQALSVSKWSFTTDAALVGISAGQRFRLVV